MDLGVPVIGFAREREKRYAAHLSFAGGIAQFLAGVRHLLERSFELELIAIEKCPDVVELSAVDVDNLRIRSKRVHFTTNIDFAAGHVFANAFARVTEDDDATTVHHVAGHEVGVTGATERASLHHLARARPHVAANHQLRAANGDTGNSASIAAHHHAAAVDIVTQSPTDVVVDFKMRFVGEAGTKIPGRAANLDVDLGSQTDPDVVSGVGIYDFDVLPLSSVLANTFIRLANRYFG